MYELYRERALESDRTCTESQRLRPGSPGTGLQMLTEKTFGKAATTRTWDSLKKVARETRSTRAG